MKPKILFTTAVILLLLFLVLRFGPNIGFTSFRDKPENQPCPNGIIPSNITLAFQTANGRTYLNLDIEKSLWADASKVQWDASKTLEQQPDSPTGSALFCRKGNVTGENVNQYYCYNLYYIRVFQNISSSGEIGTKTTEKFNIDLVLNEGIWTTETSGVESRGHVTFPISSAKCKPTQYLPPF
jgi:hypothetical protein